MMKRGHSDAPSGTRNVLPVTSDHKPTTRKLAIKTYLLYLFCL